MESQQAAEPYQQDSYASRLGEEWSVVHSYRTPDDAHVDVGEKEGKELREEGLYSPSDVQF